MLRRTTLILAVAVSVLQVGCTQGTESSGGCDYKMPSNAFTGYTGKHAGEGETVDMDDELWVCRNGQLVRVNN